jgi:copper oxidase (laccase) domain-containing protein
VSGALDVGGDGWWRPDWPLPVRVGALMSTRRGGVSAAPFDSLNLKSGIGDDAAAVAINQARHAARCGALPVWLKQVHGSRVVRLDGPAGDGQLEADAGVVEPGRHHRPGQDRDDHHRHACGSAERRGIG